MAKIKRRVRVIGIVIMLALWTTVGLAQQQPVFRIGVLGDEQGAIANGARLAVQEINAAGGVTGADGTAFRLELVIQPTSDGDTLPQAIANVSRASVIAVLGPETTEEVLSGLTLLQGLNLPVLTPATGDTIIASDATGRIFRTRAAEALQGRALANYVVSDRGLSRIVTVQLDLESTAGVIGFATAASSLGTPPQASLLLQSGIDMSQLAANVISLNPQIAVVYGPPALANQLFQELRTSGWAGAFAYNQAYDDRFREDIPLSQLNGIVGVTTWPYAAPDDISNAFLTAYIRTYRSIPGPIEAASYDAVNILAEAINLPGDLRSNLTQISDIEGAQGILHPATLTRGEISDNVAVTELGEFGGQNLRLRFAGNQRIIDEGIIVIGGATPAPAATATPEGVVLTIKSSVQNVRTGPSTAYDTLGQMRQGEQARVIGATIDFSWVVIQYRGQNGWLFTSLLDVFGDRTSLPVIPIPPTPTPGPPTPTPTAQPFADIVITSASPSNLTRGFPFTVVVTVLNQGPVGAGPFAVATTFEPDSAFSAVNLDGLGAGQQTTINLGATLNSSTGLYGIVIVADLNQQVDEGPGGEANNFDFVFNYKVDRPILNTGTLTLNPGGTLNLEGSGTVDLNWNGAGTSLDFIAPPVGSGMYLITDVAGINAVHYDKINPALATTHSLNVALLPNATIGIVTAEGNRGVLHVDNVTSGGPIVLTYRVYLP